jgi:hypothetical protein
MESVECIHGMVPEWCANCKGLKTPEEEEKEIDSSLDRMLNRWNQ